MKTIWKTLKYRHREIHDCSMTNVGHAIWDEIHCCINIARVVRSWFRAEVYEKFHCHFYNTSKATSVLEIQYSKLFERPQTACKNTHACKCVISKRKQRTFCAIHGIVFAWDANIVSREDVALIVVAPLEVLIVEVKVVVVSKRLEFRTVATMLRQRKYMPPQWLQIHAPRELYALSSLLLLHERLTVARARRRRKIILFNHLSRGGLYSFVASLPCSVSPLFATFNYWELFHLSMFIGAHVQYYQVCFTSRFSHEKLPSEDTGMVITTK